MLSSRILQPFVAPQIQNLDNISTIDWNLINDLDPDQIRRNHDSESVQEFISAFLSFSFNNSDKQSLLHPLAPRMLMLAQVAFDYLLHLNKNYAKALEQNKNKMTRLRKQYKILDDSYKKAKDLIDTLRGSLETCPICQRRFKSGPYLDQHIRRKHPELIESWNSLRTQTPLRSQSKTDVKQLVEEINKIKEVQSQMPIYHQQQPTQIITIPVSDQHQQQQYYNQGYPQQYYINNANNQLQQSQPITVQTDVSQQQTSTKKQKKTAPVIPKEQEELNELFNAPEQQVRAPLSPNGPLNPFAVFKTSDVSSDPPLQEEEENMDNVVTKRTPKPQQSQPQQKKVKLDDDELSEPDMDNYQQQMQYEEEHYEQPKQKQQTVTEKQPKKPTNTNSAAMKKARQFLNPSYREQQNHMDTSEFESRVADVAADIKTQVQAQTYAKLKAKKEELSDGEIDDNFTLSDEDDNDIEESFNEIRELEEKQELPKPERRQLLTVTPEKSSQDKKGKAPQKQKNAPKKYNVIAFEHDSDHNDDEYVDQHLTATNPFEIQSSEIQKSSNSKMNPFEIETSQENASTLNQTKNDPFEIESSLMRSTMTSNTTATQQTSHDMSHISGHSSSKKPQFSSNVGSGKYKKRDQMPLQADESFRESYYHSDNNSDNDINQFTIEEETQPRPNLRGAEISSDLFEDSSTFLAEKAKLLPQPKNKPPQQPKRPPMKLLNLDDSLLFDDKPQKENEVLPRPAGIQKQADSNKLKGFFSPDDFLDD